MQWLEGYLIACMSHYIVDLTRSCDPCTYTVPIMCNQRHYDQVLYVRESKLFSTPHRRISDIRLYLQHVCVFVCVCACTCMSVCVMMFLAAGDDRRVYLVQQDDVLSLVDSTISMATSGSADKLSTSSLTCIAVERCEGCHTIAVGQVINVFIPPTLNVKICFHCFIVFVVYGVDSVIFHALQCMQWGFRE